MNNAPREMQQISLGTPNTIYPYGIRQPWNYMRPYTSLNNGKILGSRGAHSMSGILTMTTIHNRPTVTLQLCVRSLAPSTERKRLETVIDRLEQLASENRITSFNVTVWGDRMPLDRAPRTDAGRQLCHLLGLFEQWDDQPGRTIRPFFETHSRTCTLVDATIERREMALPELALAEFYDDKLVWVSPHMESNIHHTVEDHLDAISTTDRPANSIESAPEVTLPQKLQERLE